MRFYEGSVGDKMTHFKGSKLPLSDVLRFAFSFLCNIIPILVIFF